MSDTMSASALPVTCKEPPVTRQKPFTQSARLLRTTLCLIVLMITSQLFPASVLAQSGNAPLNLGTVIQKSTAGAPPPRVYLKLPNEIPIPAPKPPAPAKSETTAEQTAQDGQSATSSQEGNAGQPAAPAAEGSTMEQAPASAQTQPAPAAPVIQPGGIARLHLEALLTDTSPALQRGVNWRIFREERDKNGHLPMLKNVDGGLFDTELEPGSYIIYAGYGYANLTKRIVLEKAGSYSESFNLRAGAVRLNAVATGDVPLDNNILTFDIYKTGGVEESSQDLIVKNVKPEHVVKLTRRHLPHHLQLWLLQCQSPRRCRGSGR